MNINLFDLIMLMRFDTDLHITENNIIVKTIKRSDIQDFQSLLCGYENRVVKYITPVDYRTLEVGI